jgi:hypothetical protein
MKFSVYETLRESKGASRNFFGPVKTGENLPVQPVRTGSNSEQDPIPNAGYHLAQEILHRFCRNLTSPRIISGFFITFPVPSNLYRAKL